MTTRLPPSVAAHADQRTADMREVLRPLDHDAIATLWDGIAERANAPRSPSESVVHDLALIGLAHVLGTLDAEAAP